MNAITYKRIKKGQYKVTLNGKDYFVSQLLSGNWTIQTLDREVSQVVNTKGLATVWLYKNVLNTKA